jgi:hypothetical protein
MDITQYDDGDVPDGDLLVMAGAIEAYLRGRGLPKPNAYYLRRSGWPIGATAGSGGKLIASKRRLDRHIDMLTRGPAAARPDSTREDPPTPERAA